MSKITVNGINYDSSGVANPLATSPNFLGSLVLSDTAPLMFADVTISYNYIGLPPTKLRFKRFSDDLEDKEVFVLELKSDEVKTISLKEMFFDSVEIDDNFVAANTTIYVSGLKLRKKNIGTKLSNQLIINNDVYVPPQNGGGGVGLTPEQELLFSNKLKSYVANENLLAGMGEIVRIADNNRLYLYIGGFPFITTDIYSEASEVVPKWQILGASFPAVYVKNISSLSIAPLTTLDLFISGSYFTPDTTVLIDNVFVNSVIFIDDNNLKINITTGNTLENNLFIIVDNGIPKLLTQVFNVSLGSVFIPALNTNVLFELVNGTLSNLSFGFGLVRNLGGFNDIEVVKIDKILTGDWEVEYDVTTGNNGEVYEGDVGISPVGDVVTGRSTCKYMMYHQMNRIYFYNYAVKIGEKGQVYTNHKIKKIGTVVQFICDGFVKFTLNNQIDDSFYMYICSSGLSTYENIKLTQY